MPSEGSADMDAYEVLDACRQARVRLVRFLWCDNGCTIRGKAAPSTCWRSAWRPAST
ncbi:MAG: hypothetical protein M3N17_01460 [Actinomycetota bacterium]|nr:hypothetical protein [Actinomycetota bacterium]